MRDDKERIDKGIWPPLKDTGHQLSREQARIMHQIWKESNQRAAVSVLEARRLDREKGQL
ncbi:MAG: hypothetical protein DMG65_14025 [Candidatus Angelobacter sp. Gp1-AA117]|nr:MAG: hypothetical protein DMG65_14025 [Candidatus Angelobacter sp. Gp1-AA117]